MVGAMTRHFHSLRRMVRDNGWIHTLLGKYIFLFIARGLLPLRVVLLRFSKATHAYYSILKPSLTSVRKDCEVLNPVFSDLDSFFSKCNAYLRIWYKNRPTCGKWPAEKLTHVDSTSSILNNKVHLPFLNLCMMFISLYCRTR